MADHPFRTITPLILRFLAGRQKTELPCLFCRAFPAPSGPCPWDNRTNTVYIALAGDGTEVNIYAGRDHDGAQGTQFAVDQYGDGVWTDENIPDGDLLAWAEKVADAAIAASGGTIREVHRIIDSAGPGQRH